MPEPSPFAALVAGVLGSLKRDHTPVANAEVDEVAARIAKGIEKALEAYGSQALATGSVRRGLLAARRAFEEASRG